MYQTNPTRTSKRAFRWAPAGSRLLGLALAVLVAAATSACAASGERTSGSDSRVITQEQLAEVHANHLYEAVERLRPTWLRSRGSRSVNLQTEIIVATDGSYFGDVETLRQIAPDNVREIRYLTGSEATHRVQGIGAARHVEAAIMVQLRGGG